MIYRRLTAIVFILALAFCILPNPQALAANDDFEVEYEFFPETTGFKGGDVLLTLTIENTGSTNITWVDVVINTSAAFNQRWTGTITPGMTRTVAFTVRFYMGDVNNDKILQVSMNNNSSSNPDGVKMFTFQIETMNPIYENSVSYSPALAVYNIGDSVRITHTFKNNFETHATTHTFTRIFIYVNDELRSTSEYLPHGNVFPDATIAHITDLSFDESYVGEVRISSDIYFSLIGEEYDYGGRTATFTVVPPEPDIDFTATLYATPVEIEAGEMVAFNINLENRGSDTIDRFEIRNSEGGLIITTGSFAPGDSRPAGILSAIHETSDISYVVIGYADGYSVSHETNIVHITVTEPAATEAPTETPTPSPTAEPSPAETAEATPGIEASPSQSPAETIATPVLSDDATAVPGEESIGEETEFGFGQFILIALAVLIIAAIIILSVILIKRRKGEKIKDSDFE